MCWAGGASFSSRKNRPCPWRGAGQLFLVGLLLGGGRSKEYTCVGPCCIVSLVRARIFLIFVFKNLFVNTGLWPGGSKASYCLRQDMRAACRAGGQSFYYNIDPFPWGGRVNSLHSFNEILYWGLCPQTPLYWGPCPQTPADLIIDSIF